ncbi:MAG: hypothetical protein DLM58_17790 [Pseudonocardiales bacterium]|nr:MAG: hypothetical protein DLM58_17790 [Pseudonocardiales bacterium]
MEFFVATGDVSEGAYHMVMGFERFDKVAAVAVTKPARVTVSTAGVFSLTWKAYEMLEKPPYVAFFYDAERRVIGISASESDVNSYQVRLPRTESGGPGARGAVSFRGETFLKYYEINFSKVWRRTPWMEANFLCITVDDSDGAPRVAADSAPDRIE